MKGDTFCFHSKRNIPIALLLYFITYIVRDHEYFTSDLKLTVTIVILL